MNFAAPFMLWWLALAVPVVALYVLKVRLRRVPVSTLMFWDRVYQEKAPRSLFERLRHLMSLLCQLLLVGLLALALADPFTDAEAAAARSLVLVLDTSASMNAPADPADPAGGTRLDAAKAEALRIVRGLRHRDRAAVVTAGAAAAVACGTTGHPPTLAEAVTAAPPTDAPGAVADALTLARRLVAGRANGRVLLLSDRDPPDADSVEGVTLLPFGEPGGNVAVTAFQTRRSLTDPTGYEILAEVSNFHDEPVACRLDLDLAGVPVDVVPLELDAGEVWRRTFTKTDEAGGLLEAKITFEGSTGDDEVVGLGGANLLDVDDVARAVLPARERVPVVLVTPGNLFLQQVFAANPLVDLTVRADVPASTPEGTVLVLHREVPDALPAGPVFVVDPRSDCDLFTVGDELTNPAVAATDAADGSPLLANVRLDRVEIPKARRVKMTPGDATVTVLAEADGAPLLFTARREKGKALVLAVDFDATDLPLRTAFPILAANALTWFTDAAGELRPAAATGAVVAVPLPDGADSEDWSVVPPSGVARPLPAGLDEVTLGPLADAGLWHVAPVRPPETGPDATFPDAAGWPEGTVFGRREPHGPRRERHPRRRVGLRERRRRGRGRRAAVVVPADRRGATLSRGGVVALPAEIHSVNHRSYEPGAQAPAVRITNGFDRPPAAAPTAGACAPGSSSSLPRRRRRS